MHYYVKNQKSLMRKTRILCIFAIVSAVFLTAQLYFIKDVSKQRKEIFDGTSQGTTQSPLRYVPTLSTQSHDNIRDFTVACVEHDVMAFLIDPYILTTVMSNVSHSTRTCKYLCTKQAVVSFGVLDSIIKEKDQSFLETVQSMGFTVLTFSSQETIGDSTELVVTHYMLSRRGHTVHLLVFFERSASSIWWHGPFSWGQWSRGDIDEVSLNLTEVQFGKFAGAYDKMETVRVKMDEVTMYAPRYPTLFLNQIPQSRFIECNNTRAKIFYSKHKQDVSSNALIFRKRARNLLAQAKQTLDELGIRFWISSGTCLGWFRQCDIIPYSKDVDIGIWIKDYDVRLMPAMQMTGMPLKYLFGKVEDSYELSFQGGEVKLDIFFFYEEGDTMWNGGTQARTGKKFKYSFPKFTLCWTEFMDLKLRVPCETQSYIEANYGSHWMQPVKEWDWKKSPANVQPNGAWPQDQWDKVIQHFDV